jgi:hypothetical protein
VLSWRPSEIKKTVGVSAAEAWSPRTGMRNANEMVQPARERFARRRGAGDG